MNILDILVALEAAGTLTSAAKAACDWLKGKHSRNDIESDLQMVLNQLPHGADAGEIVCVLEAFYKAKGGDLLFKAGNDGGGCVRIAGGDGGTNGKGGTVTISGSKFIGCNAT